MATRVLPGVYVSLNDLSQVPEGAQSLNVGYVLKANRGPINKANLVTSPTDFLTKYTFSGQPSQTDDPTFHTILKVLTQTNSMYISRASNNPLYGGAFVKKSKAYGRVVSTNKDEETITIDGAELPEIGEAIMIANTNVADGYFVVKSVEGKVIKVTGNISVNYGKLADISSVSQATRTFIVAGDKTADLTTDSRFTTRYVGEDEKVKITNYTVKSISYTDTSNVTAITTKEAIVNENIEGNGELYFYNQAEGSSLLRKPVVALTEQKIGNISAVEIDEEYGYTIYVEENVAAKISAGDVITVKGTSESSYTNNDGNYTVLSATRDDEANLTVIVVEEAVVEAGEGGAIYFNSLKDPDKFKEHPEDLLGEDDLMLICGIDPGAYNAKERFAILSALDNKDSMIYYKGALGLFEKPCTFDTMTLSVTNAETGDLLESFTFSRDPEAVAIDGSLLYVDDVVKGSAYIKIINNTANTDAPNSTISGSPVQASGGSDGEPVSPSDLTAALSVFEDKTIPVSILGNGCSTQAESTLFQQALLALAVNRKDCVAFLNSRKEDEKATLPSTRAQNIVDYKKNVLANTSFYGTMYAPHVKTSDIFNSKTVEIGSEGVAIAGWLEVINNLNYPYAYAGPRNGLVTGVTTDWKIGDTSGEAELLNDASINYVAFDGKVGRYYMQTQNTLQVANSAMRNLGAVLNVLDIKEALATNLKEYLGLPITDDLRRDILDACNDYLSPMVGTRFYNYSFQDVSTANDIDNDTLRYFSAFSISRYLNRIYLSLNIVKSSFNFSILQSA